MVVVVWLWLFVVVVVVVMVRVVVVVVHWTWRILFQTIFVNSVSNNEIYNMFIIHVSKWLTDFWTALYTQLQASWFLAQV